MSNFNPAAEQFGDFSKNSVDAALKFARISFDSVERMFALNLEAAKVSLDESAKSAKSLTGVKDVQELTAARTKAAETGLEFIMGYSKNFYEISTAAQAQYTALVEQGVSSMQKSVAEGLDKVSKSAPAGSDVAIAAMKSGLAASAAAMDSFTKAAKQASTLADTTFRNATETATKATATASKRK
jgi:phasin family protein